MNYLGSMPLLDIVVTCISQMPVFAVLETSVANMKTTTQLKSALKNISINFRYFMNLIQADRIALCTNYDKLIVIIVHNDLFFKIMLCA